MQRLLKNSVYVVLLVAILIGVSRVYEGPPTPPLSIQGSSPFEKVFSMVKYLNAQEGNDFAKVYFQGYDGEARIWRYSVSIDPKLFSQPTTRQEQQEQQVKLEQYWSVIIRSLFVNTATWDETARGIVVTALSPVPLDDSAFAYGFVYHTYEVGIENIRKFPEDWSNFTNVNKAEKFLGLPASDLQRILQGSSQETNGADAPQEGGK